MVDVPTPPDLTNRGVPRGFEWTEDTSGEEEFRRGELEDHLQDGAWTEGFNEWAEHTDLGEAQIRVVADLGLFEALDFYWDPTDDRLRFDAPAVPEDWRGRDSTGVGARELENALGDLGRTVQEMLEAYLRDETPEDWGDDEFDADDG